MNKLCFKTSKEAAEAVRELFEYHPKTDERGAFYFFKLEVIGDENALYEAFSGKMRNLQLDEDSRYSFIVEAIDNILGSSSESIEALRDEIHEWADADTDVYTSDLTEWLGKNDYNVYYLTQAIEEYEPKDGFNALQIAQLLAREEVYGMVLDLLEELMNKNSEEE